MKEFVLKLDLQDYNDKRKALKIVSALSGIDSISMDMKNRELAVIGTVDPVSVVSKLRKYWPTDIIVVRQAKETEKKEEPKKEGPKNEEMKKEESTEEPKKEEGKTEEPAKTGEEKKVEPETEVGIPMPYRPYYPPAMHTYYPPMNTHHYVPYTADENPNPNACAVC